MKLNKKIEIVILCILFSFLLAGCATSQEEKKAISDYFKCVDEKAKYLDDRISSAGDIATASIYACSKYENIVNPYGGDLGRDIRKTLREQAYTTAINSITKNRKITSSSTNSDSCPLYITYNSCYEAGFVNKNTKTCTNVSLEIKNFFKEFIPDSSLLLETQKLCLSWCFSGITEKSLMSKAELCNSEDEALTKVNINYVNTLSLEDIINLTV